jgi:phage terminase large subunit
MFTASNITTFGQSTIENGVVNIHGTPLLERNADSTSRIVINRGGARSSKSFSVLQLIILLCLAFSGLKVLVVRKHLPSLRISTLFMFREILMLMGLSKYVKEEKMGLNFWINGNLIHFGSIDDPEKIKSTDWNYIFMEEANEFDYADYMTELYIHGRSK